MITKGLLSINLVKNSSGMCGVMLLPAGGGELGFGPPDALKPSYPGEEGDAFGSVGALIARPPPTRLRRVSKPNSVGVGGNLSWDCALTRANAPRERGVSKRS